MAHGFAFQTRPSGFEPLARTGLRVLRGVNVHDVLQTLTLIEDDGDDAAHAGHSPGRCLRLFGTRVSNARPPECQARDIALPGDLTRRAPGPTARLPVAPWPAGAWQAADRLDGENRPVRCWDDPCGRGRRRSRAGRTLPWKWPWPARCLRWMQRADREG